MFKMETVKPFGRGLVGSSKLTVMKDRHGYIRARCPDGQRVGVFVVASHDDGTADVELVPPGEMTEDLLVDDEFLQELSQVVEAAEDWITTTEIRKRVTGANQKIAFGLDDLVRERYLRRRKDGKAVLYQSERPYRLHGGSDE